LAQQQVQTLVFDLNVGISLTMFARKALPMAAVGKFLGVDF
jgi:hypothetical protein